MRSCAALAVLLMLVGPPATGFTSPAAPGDGVPRSGIVPLERLIADLSELLRRTRDPV